MIGLAGRFPGARSVADFWRNLLAGEDSRRELLEKPEWFDAEFFGISPGDAEAMDPQHRVFLEECWAALEDAACDPAKFAGAIGVFGGCSRRTYPVENGNDADEFASRVAARLNLRGPAVTVQTACSTSLAAVCQAVQSLRCYGCDMALAGGASIVFPQAAGGVGVVALKRLSDAVETGDFIYAVIQAATLNHDGATPSASSHAEVIAAAHTLAGISAESVTFIEADAAELDALTRAFRTTTAEKNFCALGSVKTNLGNVGAAAGIAGLIKTALALRYETIPASLDRPHSQTTETPFFHIGHRMEWPTGETPRRAGVCSFGIGGTNAHIVLEEPPRRIAAETGRAENLLILSGKSESTLAQRASDLADWIEARPEFSLADIAHTLVAGRRHFEHRRAVVCPTRELAIAALRELDPKRTIAGKAEAKRVAFLFPGHGAQFVGMGAELYEYEPVFRDTLDEVCAVLQPHVGRNLRALIHPADEDREEAARVLGEARYSEPAIFAVSLALARFWMSLGIQPAALLGHSSGEYAAAALAGVFSLEDAAMLVATHARLMHEQPPGCMISVSLPESEVTPLLGQRLSIAALNSPSATVISGTEEAVASLEARLAANGVACKRLETSRAFQSELCDPVIEPLTAAIRQLACNAPAIPMFSCITGESLTAKQTTDPHYWATHARETVRFSSAIKTLLHEPDMIFIECGPGHMLSQLTRQQDPARIAATSLRESASDIRTIYIGLSHLWSSGRDIQWEALHSGEARSRVPLPTYPFERRRFWPTPKGSALPPPLTAFQREHLDALAARYTRLTAESKRFAAENRDFLAAENCCAEWQSLAYPIVAERSHSKRVWDIDGNEYIDFTRGQGLIRGVSATLDSEPAQAPDLSERASALVARMNTHLPECWKAESSQFSMQLPAGFPHAALLIFHMRMRGVFVWHSRPNTLNVGHTDDDIARLAEAFDESVRALIQFLPGKAQPTAALAIRQSPAPSAKEEPADAPTSASPLGKFLIQIQTGSTQLPPLFLIPGGWGGEIEFREYAEIVRHLGPELPIYGLKARGAGTADPPHMTVLEMAADYIHEIRALWPHGPYRIVGESTGGICAYEIARQLREAGELVDFLALLNTRPPSRDNLRDHLHQQLLKESETQQTGSFIDRFRHHMDAIKGYTLGKKVRYLTGKASTRTRRRSADHRSGYEPAPEQEQHPRGQKDYPITMYKHRLRTHKGKLTLLVDETTHSEGGKLGWEKSHPGELELHTLPGDHITYIREHAGTAAAKVREILDRLSLAQKP